MVPETMAHRWPDVRNRGLVSVDGGGRAARIGADDAGAARPDADQERSPADGEGPIELYGRLRRQPGKPIFDPSIERMQARALAGRCGVRTTILCLKTHARVIYNS